MAHVWVQDDVADAWSVAPLAGADVWQLVETGRLAPAEHGLGVVEIGSALLARCNGGPSEEWVLLEGGRRELRVNGGPVRLGLRALSDRDEIVIVERDACVSRRCFFSTEQLPELQPFPAADGSVICPRCKDPIAKSQAAVKCPGCNLWHHQIEGKRNCWTYSSRCSQCDWPTGLNGQYRWSPEEL